MPVQSDQTSPHEGCAHTWILRMNAATFSQSEVCVLSSVLAAQESWSDPSTGRGGLQKKKVSFKLQYVLVVF